MPESRQRECAAQTCNATFVQARHPNGGWTRQKYCSAECQSRAKYERHEYRNAERKRNRNRQAYITARGHRKAMPRWAVEWEDKRRVEDLAEIDALTSPLMKGPHCRTKDAPDVRYFLGWYCAACGEAFVYYAKRAQSPYCTECNEAHHRRPANRRAKQNGAQYEVIVPRRVFERDAWRCQICKRKTRGVFPNPRSATVDHIVPLGKGGDHTYLNVQCACFGCNCLKQDGSANDQLRLVA